MPILGPLIKRALSLGEKLDSQQLPANLQQERTLKRLLRKASRTTFGKYYAFRDLLDQADPVGAFQRAVPLHDYPLMHDRWWHMTLNNIENVTWKGKVRYFALSSGTTGSPSKHIPVTDDMLRAMRRAALRLFMSVSHEELEPELFTKAMFMLGGTTDLQREEGHFAGDLSGINGSKVPFWLRPYYKPGAHISRINDWNERIEQIARNAPQWDVGFMVGIPAWIQLALERIIEYHRVDTIHDIWPNLRLYVHGGVHVGPYRRRFAELTSFPLIYLDTYLASEGFLAIQDRSRASGMRLLLDNGIFFEFLPFNEQNFDEEGRVRENPQCLTIEAVEAGVDYALAISTCAGAWRYLIGDTVRFTDLDRSEIQITGRTKHFLSVCGEHLSVDNMNEGVEYVVRSMGVSIPEFTVCAVRDGQFFSHRWYLGCEGKVDARRARELLDQRLQEVNDDYRTERGKRLQIELETVPLQLFYGWQEKSGKLGGQNKFPRVMKQEPFAAWESYIQQSLERASKTK